MKASLRKNHQAQEEMQFALKSSAERDAFLGILKSLRFLIVRTLNLYVPGRDLDVWRRLVDFTSLEVKLQR